MKELKTPQQIYIANIFHYLKNLFSKFPFQKQIPFFPEFNVEDCHN